MMYPDTEKVNPSIIRIREKEIIPDRVAKGSVLPAAHCSQLSQTFTQSITQLLGQR